MRPVKVSFGRVPGGSASPLLVDIRIELMHGLRVPDFAYARHRFCLRR